MILEPLWTLSDKAGPIMDPVPFGPCPILDPVHSYPLATVDRWPIKFERIWPAECLGFGEY